MANSTTNVVSNSASAQPAGGTAFRGRIEAIGPYDLLRIAVSKGSTGRLLIFNDQFDAELYYASGRFVAAVSSGKSATECLNMALQMNEGEFEFATGLEFPVEQHDGTLHDALILAIKSHYQRRVQARQDSTSDDTPFTRSSGVHRVTNDPSVTVSPVVSIEQPSPNIATAILSVSATPAPAVRLDKLLPGELGRSMTDSSGRANAKVGSVSSQEAALVALAAKLAQNLATILGMRELQRFEIVGANQRALLCSVNKEGIRFSCVASNEVNVEGIWQELGS